MSVGTAFRINHTWEDHAPTQVCLPFAQKIVYMWGQRMHGEP
jgi:hypothetical protein